MEKNIENIIRNKQYIELTAHEREMIREWVTSEEEYDQLKHVLVATELLQTKQKRELNPTVKQRLDVRFREKYAQRRLVWYNKLWLFLWPEETSIVRKPLVQLTAIGLIAVMITPFLFFNDAQPAKVASNEQTNQEKEMFEEKKIEEDKNSMSDSLYDQRSLPEEEVEVTEEEPVSSSLNSEIDANKFAALKDAEQINKADKFNDAAAPIEGWTLTDEVAESEEQVAEDLITTVPVADNKASQKENANQQAFAGSVARTEVDQTVELSADADKGYSSSKKVSAEQTLDLISALY